MKDAWVRVGGTLLVTAVVYLLLLSMVQQGFTPFEYAIFPIDDSLASTEKEIGREVASNLWIQRPLDVILLAFLLFLTSACCAAILSSRRGERY